MIFLKRWQRYARYLLVVGLLGLLVTFLRQAELDEENDDEYYEYKGWGKRKDRLEKLTGHDNSEGDLRWLPNFVKQGSRKKLVPVVVVEEHYEVLQYWFQAADLGLIPKSRNTLIHVDAHPDLDMPEMSLPWFHYPKSQAEVKRLMQNTDSYIMAAAQAGLVDHIIWIRPLWDKEKTDEVDIWFKFGTLMRRAPGDHKKNFCSCWARIPRSENFDGKREENQSPDDMTNDWQCQANDFSPLTEDASGSEINPAQCSVHTSGLLQVVYAENSQTLLESVANDEPSRTEGNKEKAILLDINEDFFGCLSDTLGLKDQGMTSDETYMLNSRVAELFCADTVFDERVGDMFYAALLNLLVNIKLQSCELKGPESMGTGGRRRTCYTSLEISNLLIEKIPAMIQFLTQVGEAEHILCLRSPNPSPNSPAAGQLQSLVLYLNNFSVKQLQHLAWLGICFDVSPTCTTFESPQSLQICQGQSQPNRTTVPLFQPLDVDIEDTAQHLSNLLSSLTSRPKFISVCRSVRDGYTPKTSFHAIERSVMDTLKSVYGGAMQRENGVHMDSHLLGGKLGWPRRFPSWNNKLLKYLSVQVVADHYKGT